MEEKVKYVSLTEVKNLLEKEEKNRELTYEQKLALEHAKHFAKLGITKAKKMVSELLELERISEPFAYKIIDILPAHPEEHEETRRHFTRSARTWQGDDESI